MIEFRTLGALSLRNPGDGVALDSILTQSKRIALLSYLALARTGGLHRRSILTGVFWPDSPESRARRALNQSLYILRKGLGEGVLMTRGDDEVGLDRERFSCDAWAFDRHVKAGRLQAAIDLYDGRLLNGFYLADSVEFEHWLEAERMHYHRRAVDATLELAVQLDGEGRIEDATAYLRKMLDHAPREERLAEALIDLLGRRGHRTAALRQFESFAARLRDELDMEPSAELVSLVASVRDAGGNGGNGGNGGTGNGSRGDMESAALVGEAPGDGNPPPGPPSAHRAGGNRRWLWAAGVAALFLGAAALLRLFTPTPGVATLEASRVIVVPATNGTGDPSLHPVGQATADWLATGLAETGIVEVVSPADVARWSHALTEKGMSPEDPAILIELAKSTGARLLVTGRFLQTGDSLHFLAQVTDVSEGSLVRAVESRRVPVADPLAGAEDLRGRLMGALGTTVDPRFSSWARASSQPPSLDAYQLYADGIDLYWQRDYVRASDAFFAAARSEATFTAPLVWAGLALTSDWFANEGATDSERWNRADSIMTVLETMKSDLPTWERAMVDYTRANFSQDAPAAYEAIRRVNEFAPDSEWLLTQARMGTNLDRPYEVLATLDRIDPDWPWFESYRRYYFGLRLHQLHRIGDYEAEQGLVLQMKEENPGRSPWSAFRSLIAVGERADVEREFRATALGNDRWLGRAWIELAAHGYEDLAAEAAEASLRQLMEAAEADRDEHWKRNAAHQLTKLERYDEALDMLVPLDPMADGYFDGLGSVGFLKARLGDREEALRIFDEMEAAPDKDFARMQRASIMIALGERERAMREFRAMRIRGVMHPEAFAPELKDYPPFEDWLKPKG